MRIGTHARDALRHHGEELRAVVRKHGAHVEGGCALPTDEVASHLARGKSSIMGRVGLYSEVTFAEAAAGRLLRLELGVKAGAKGRFEPQMSLGGRAVDVVESAAKPWPKRDEQDVRRVADWPAEMSALRPLTQHLHLALVRAAHDHHLGPLLFGVREVKFGSTIEQRLHVFTRAEPPPVEKLAQAVASPWRKLFGFDRVPARFHGAEPSADAPPVEVLWGDPALVAPTHRHLVGGPRDVAFRPPEGAKVLTLEEATLPGPRDAADALLTVLHRPKAQAVALNAMFREERE